MLTLVDNYSIEETFKVLSRDSKGSQPKYFKDNIWYKTNYTGNESLSEYLVSLVLKYSTVSDYVAYTECYINGKKGCYSENFLKSPTAVNLSFSKIYYNYYHRDLNTDLRLQDNVTDRFEFIVTKIYTATGLDISEYLSNILALDFLTLNPDRHFNNLSVIYDNGVYHTAPIFDNGQSLGANWYLTPPDLDLDEVFSKLYSQTLSGSFAEQLLPVSSHFYIDYEGLYEELIKLPKSRNLAILLNNLKTYRNEFDIVKRVWETYCAKFDIINQNMEKARLKELFNCVTEIELYKSILNYLL